MGITAISRDWGVSPAIVRVTTSDTLNTITTSGYLATQQDNIRALQNGDFEWLSSDLVAIDFFGGRGTFTRDSTTNAFVVISVDGASQSFTPTVTFATLGNATFTYSAQVGEAVRNGNKVDARVSIGFTATHTTSSGNLIIQGLPYSVVQPLGGSLFSTGVLGGNLSYPAGRTVIVPVGVASSTTGVLRAMGSAVADTIIGSANITTTLAYHFDINFQYLTS